MTTVTITEAQAKLGELIDLLRPGEELMILRDSRPIAKLVAADMGPLPRKPGSAVGRLTMVVDSDEHLEDFAEYM